MASPTIGPILLRISGVHAAGILRRELSDDDLADLAGVDLLLGHAVARVEAADVSDKQIALRLGAGGHDLLRIGDCAGDRLFQEHMLAGFERRDCGRGVLVPHGDDRHGVDLGIGKHVAVVGIGLAHAELGRLLLQPVRAARAQRREFEARHADDGFAVDLAEPAQTDHADADRAHRLFPLVRLNPPYPL